MDTGEAVNEGRTGGIRNVGTRLSAEDYDALEARARDRERSIAAHVRWLVRQDIASDKQDAADRAAA